jgi:hypothetical protein
VNSGQPERIESVPSAFRSATPSEPLSQGDIFDEFPIAVTKFEQAKQLKPCGDGYYEAVGIDGDLTQGMVVPAMIHTTPAIVVTQSCDALDQGRILLAPLLAFDPKNSWKDIQEAATLLFPVWRLYLPDDDSLGLPRRVVHLGQTFSAETKVAMEMIRRGRRRATLADESLAYLQFRLSLFFSRFARDDFAWPSIGDLALKRQFLKDKIEKQGSRMDTERGKINSARPGNEVEREKSKVALGKMETELARWKADLQETERFLEQQKQHE